MGNPVISHKIHNEVKTNKLQNKQCLNNSLIIRFIIKVTGVNRILHFNIFMCTIIKKDL